MWTDIFLLCYSLPSLPPYFKKQKNSDILHKGSIVYLDSSAHHQCIPPDTGIYIHKEDEVLGDKWPVDGTLKGQTGRILRTCRRIHLPQSPVGNNESLLIITTKSHSMDSDETWTHSKVT